MTKPAQYGDKNLDAQITFLLFAEEKEILRQWGLHQIPRMKIGTVVKVAVGKFLAEIKAKDQS